MARVRTAAHPAPVEPEDDSQDIPESALSEQPPSKAEAVRRAMADGLTKPGDIQGFVKAHFGLDIPKPQISSYAAQQRAREAKVGGSVQPRQSTQSQGIPAGFSADVKELRELIEKAGGADELKDLIGQLSALLGKYGAGGLTELIEAIG